MAYIGIFNLNNIWLIIIIYISKITIQQHGIYIVHNVQQQNMLESMKETILSVTTIIQLRL